MENNKLKLKGFMLSGLIIIISFVYAINIQPKVIGDTENIKYISKELIENYGTDNPILCNHNPIGEDEINNDYHRLDYNLYCNNFKGLFFSNNILKIILNYMIKMNNIRDFV